MKDQMSTTSGRRVLWVSRRALQKLENYCEWTYRHYKCRDKYYKIRQILWVGWSSSSWLYKCRNEIHEHCTLLSWQLRSSEWSYCRFEILKAFVICKQCLVFKSMLLYVSNVVYIASRSLMTVVSFSFP